MQYLDLPDYYFKQPRPSKKRKENDSTNNSFCCYCYKDADDFLRLEGNDFSETDGFCNDCYYKTFRTCDACDQNIIFADTVEYIDDRSKPIITHILCNYCFDNNEGSASDIARGWKRSWGKLGEVYYYYQLKNKVMDYLENTHDSNPILKALAIKSMKLTEHIADNTALERSVIKLVKAHKGEPVSESEKEEEEEE